MDQLEVLLLLLSGAAVSDVYTMLVSGALGLMLVTGDLGSGAVGSVAVVVIWCCIQCWLLLLSV